MKPTDGDLAEIHISTRLRQLLLEQFTPEQLRHMASNLEAREPDMRRRRRWRELLDDDAFDELAEMIVSGRTPSLGWWKRHRNESAA